MNVLIIAASFSSFVFGLFGVNWDKVDRKIEEEFPNVEFISTEQLHDSRQAVHLFDVREPEEFAVSHLAGAKNLTAGKTIALSIPDKSAAIVVYCSVGYRSAGVAAELEQLGYNNVLNLRHSIFEWVEKGYPLVNESGGINKVHPFNRAWGSLVDESFHQYPE